MYGKILFYNEQNGDGIIITKDNQKIKFNIQEWNDYSKMPSLGLEISIKLIDDGIAKEIHVVGKDDEIQKEEDSCEKSETSEISETSVAIKPLKCKNKDLEKAGNELDTLLNDSSDNIDSLNNKIILSMSISETMHDYFDSLKKELNKREGYKKVQGRLFSFKKVFMDNF